MAHTPGPWTIGEPDEDGDGVTIESQQGPVAFRVIDCSANLIAAAPELLAALKEAEEFIGKQNELLLPASEGGNVEWNQHCVEVWSGCVAAINKAEGKVK